MNADFYEVALNALRLRRKEVFGLVDNQQPISETKDSAIPQIGFIGQNYRRGGTILLGINPGGGGDTYTRSSEDSRLLPMIQALRDGEAAPEKLQAMFDQCSAAMRTWNLWRIVSPALTACGNDQSEVAYLNWCPFRTRADKMPHAHTMRRCRDISLGPLLRELSPSRIIALGKKVGNWLEKEPQSAAIRYVVPRTIGDSHLSSDAITVLEAIKKSSGNRR